MSGDVVEEMKGVSGPFLGIIQEIFDTGSDPDESFLKEKSKEIAESKGCNWH